MSRARSGQITVTTAGTAVQGPSTPAWPSATWLIRALSSNTGVVYFGNDGSADVASTNGFELSAGDSVFVVANTLSDFYFDAATNGDKFCWFLVGKG